MNTNVRNEKAIKRNNNHGLSSTMSAKSCAEYVICTIIEVAEAELTHFSLSQEEL